jgi:hypothetical protein
MDVTHSAITAIASGLLGLTVTIHADGGTDDRRIQPRELSLRGTSVSRIITAPTGTTSTLRVVDVRLAAAAEPAPIPSAVLKFDLVNQGFVTVSDVSLEVTIFERSSTDAEVFAPPRVVAGPFTIRGDVDLRAGYTVNYEMLLRNMSADCDCVANVAIVGGRAALSDETTAR